ncbi:MAG TPA: hypothetical protein PLN33_07475 [Hyphomonadaceae bacterium]|jgi:NAD(P)-dependent dehydrogenase (short-subunit alcohol dehydrogenase family)|nr:hypothetical protein [Hyphomonadaceae bacterium]HPN04217.1 hypothetical protein [Hyphomonadaceae bacterium]
MSVSKAILVAGDGELSQAIASSLEGQGYRVVPISSRLPEAVGAFVQNDPVVGGLVIVSPAPARDKRFLDITDADLDETLAAFLDLFESLSIATPHLADAAPVVYVGHRGHLGAWQGAHENAFAGAVAGLMRSLTLEGASRHLRVNMIATDFADDATRLQPQELVRQVADLAAFLVSPASAALSGELLLANRGASLRFREARERSPADATADRSGAIR